MNLRVRRSIQREFNRLSSVYTRVAAARPKRELSEFVAWVHPRPRQWVLDAACGPGTLACAMAPLAAQVCGVDLCPRMIQAARALAYHSPHPLFLTVGDVEHLPFHRGLFDVTTCTYSFANFPDPLRVLKELARVTGPGGRVAIADVVAPEDAAGYTYFNQLEALRSAVYTRILRCSDFLELLGRAGLHVRKWELHRRRRKLREWLSLSPAAGNPQRADRLREMVLDSVEEDVAGLSPREIDGDIVFYHTTAWFLLSRP